MVLFLFCWALAVLKPKGKLPMSSAQTGHAQDVTHGEAPKILPEEPKLELAQAGQLFSKISWPGFFGGCTTFKAAIGACLGRF